MNGAPGAYGWAPGRVEAKQKQIPGGNDRKKSKSLRYSNDGVGLFLAEVFD